VGLRDRIPGTPAPEPEPEVVPTGRTIDGEVGEIQLNLGVENDEAAPEVSTVLGEAIAAHFGVPAENLTAFVVAAEYANEEGMTLSSAWSISQPAWRLYGLATWLRKHLEAGV
jgi:hypothetical protein